MLKVVQEPRCHKGATSAGTRIRQEKRLVSLYQRCLQDHQCYGPRFLVKCRMNVKTTDHVGSFGSFTFDYCMVAACAILEMCPSLRKSAHGQYCNWDYISMLCPYLSSL